MSPGDQIILSFEVPSQAVARAGGNIPRATTALVTLFREHPQTKAALNIFGIRIDKILGVNDAPQVSIIFVTVTETKHQSSDAIGFLNGVWHDVAKAISGGESSSGGRKPWWRFW
jgi:hypothetical protein